MLLGLNTSALTNDNKPKAIGKMKVIFFTFEISTFFSKKNTISFPRRKIFKSMRNLWKRFATCLAPGEAFPGSRLPWSEAGLVQILRVESLGRQCQKVLISTFKALIVFWLSIGNLKYLSLKTKSWKRRKGFSYGS